MHRLLAAGCNGVYCAACTWCAASGYEPDNMLMGHDGTLLLNDYDVSCTTADLSPRSMLQVGTPAFTSPCLESMGQYQFGDDWLSLGLSFAYLADLYPKFGDSQVKLDALQRLQQQVWCPASITNEIQQATSRESESAVPNVQQWLSSILR